ncbi:MAG TPA: PAS domain-containing protein [Longimicrobium sp.]|nr:PAS domain-containing protein [Longimicrobium sp.]
MSFESVPQRELDALLRFVDRQAPGMRSSVLLLDGDRLRHGSAPRLPEAYCRAIDGIRIGPAVGSCGTAAYRRAPVVVADIAADPLWADFRALAAEHGLAACWSTPIFGSGGRLLGTFAVYYDEPRAPDPRDQELIGTATLLASAIIERARAAAELEAERGRLATVFHAAPAYIAVVRGPDHVFELANPRYRRLAGDRDLLGKPAREAVPELVSQGYIDLLDRVFATGEPFVATEARVLFRAAEDGPLEEHFLDFVYQPLRDADGAVTGILAHGVEVTAGVRARAALVDANREITARAEEIGRVQREAAGAHAALDAFHEAAPLPTALLDRELRYRRINDALAAFYGLPREEVLGRTIHEVVPAYAHRVEPNFRRVLETGEPVRNVEAVVPSRVNPGEERAVLLNYFPVRDAGGEVAGVGFIGLDVTERHQVEAGRREQAQTVEALHRVGQALASELGQERIVQVVTDAATSLTGAEFGAFFYNVVDPRGEHYTLYTVSGAPREAFSRFPMPRATEVFHPTFHGPGVVRSDDITQDPRYGKMAPHFGMPEGHLPVTSYLAVPVVSRTGEVLGGLFFGHQKPGMFRERHERLAVGVAGWAAVALDNARLYEAEQRARAEAERANRVKSEFLTTMSHELRTPLNAMIGYADLLAAGIPEPIAPGPRAKVERIGISARHLLALIEEILTFSRLEAGEERVEVEAVPLERLVAEVQALTEPLALARGLAYDCAAPGGAPPLESDGRKLRQVLVNLVGNAIKFTREGSVSLRVEDAGEAVLFHVRDTGAGIAAEHLEKIFEPFWQVRGGTTRTAEGTGLGLSVTRRLARLLGGDVSVESELGAGSTFTVRIPRRISDAG